MKKSLIALAVASAFAAPAFAATSNVDIYGVLSFSVDWVDTGEPAGDSSDLNTGVDNVSRIGFKGSEDLGGGLKAIWQIESALNTTGGNGALASRNTFVGLAGGFGTVIMGRHDTPYKLATGKLDPFGDTLGDYNAIISATQAGSAGSRFDARADRTIAYITPTFSGFHAAVAYVEAKANEGTGNDETQAWSLMGMYENGPLFASLAYENHAGSLLGSTATREVDAWKVGLGYSFGDLKIGAVYEDIDHDAANNANSREAWYLSAAYAMGPMTLKAAYGTAEDSEAIGAKDGADFWALGLDYNLSKRTAVYAVYAKLDHDTAQTGTSGYRLGPQGYAAGASATNTSDSVDGFSIGIKHSF